VQQAFSEISQDVVLVGGGHAHALVIRMLAMKPVLGVRITLISPATHTPYSGMLPGLVAGHYSFEQTHIDLARLCQWAGVRFVCSAVTAIHPDTQRLSIENRPAIGYDVLSIDTGSEPELDSVPGARDWSVPVKPVAHLWQRWLNLEQRLCLAGAGKNHRIAVVGGGAGSVELILAMAKTLVDRPVSFELFCGSDEILSAYNPRARGSVEQALGRFNIKLHVNSRVKRVEEKALSLTDGSSHYFDELFWCTGAAAASWIAHSGLKNDKAGFIVVRDTLQSMDYDNIFAAGDVSVQLNFPRPKAGVYAVRQAPVLAHNLQALLLSKPLKMHVPQNKCLSLLSLGDKTATANRGVFSATGAWVWHWKNRIDLEFMARFEDLPTEMQHVKSEPLPGALSGAQSPCGGCGAKVGAGTLGSVLADLARDFPVHCPNSAQAQDVAAVPGSQNISIVQSIDVLREMVSDPWLMGRIAANHALSDLYASGARPVSALATLTVPFSSSSIQERELTQLLAGALYEFAAVDCKLLGGHSLQGAELNIGFVVNGAPIAAGGDFLAKVGLRPGDHLLLTKPLGSGALFASHMQLRADGRDIHGAINAMLLSNARAGELAVEHSASAVTDVTGFGLLGHLLEMLGPLNKAEYGAKLQLSNVPLLTGALESIRHGIRSTMHQSNSTSLDAIGHQAVELDPDAIDLLVDPQTSGGLLIGIAPEASARLCEALRTAGYEDCAVIGEVITLDPHRSGPLVLE
jgi:selenide,water dikinase